MDEIAGVWILRSFHMEDLKSGQRTEVFGPNPRGVLIIHPGGRMYRAAKLLMDRDGKDAAFVAARREAELSAKGDIEGVAAWRGIRRAIEELQRGREPGEALN